MARASRFWEETRLEEMSVEEWEALCDGCAKCCLTVLQDETDEVVYYTDVHCRLLDSKTCRCTDYENRTTRVPSCIRLTLENLEKVFWMPNSCAYRRLAEGRGLAHWHPLLSGSAESVHEADRSIRGRSASEETVAEGDLEDHLVEWPVTEE